MLLASLLPAVAVAATAPEAPPAFRPVMLERSGSVLVKSLPASSAAATHRTRPFLRLTPGGAARPQASAIGVTTLPAGPSAPSAVENVLTKFPMISLDQQLAAPFGKDQFVTPPDTQVAAGPSHLVEMVNSSGSVWDKSGTLLTLFDLNVFFAVPPGSSFSDPRILYDRDSQRWFASGVAFVPSTLASVVVIDVSTTSNPLDKWVQYSAAKSSNLHDQPKIGVSADKVVLSWNDFSPFGVSFRSRLLPAESRAGRSAYLEPGRIHRLQPRREPWARNHHRHPASGKRRLERVRPRCAANLGAASRRPAGAAGQHRHQ
jgi:hypothetical protein